MAKYSYAPELPAPGKWSDTDFADPKLRGALRMLVRSLRDEVQAFQPPEGISLRRETVRGWDGGEIRCFVFEPEAPGASMLYCHGGGFFLPVQPGMMRLAAIYSKALTLRVFLPEYRILPEYRAPYPFRDCLSVLERILEAGDEYMLYGDSAGGAIAAGLALWSREHGLRSARGQCLIYPVLDDRCSRYPSMRQYSEAAWTLRNNLAMWREYLKDGGQTPDIPLVPMRAEDLSGLPKAYIEPQEIDILRDEAIAYAERLKAVGNETVLNIVKGSYHGADMNTDVPFVRSVIAKRIGIMRQMLG